MSYYCFTGCIQVEIQGSRVLRIIDQQKNFAKYSVIGFHENVVITDFRAECLKALNRVTKNGNGSFDFAEIFSSPAMAVINIPTPEKVYVELYDTTEKPHDKILWIAIGLKDKLPVLNYIFRKMEPFLDGGYAFMAFYDDSQSDYSSSPSPKSSIEVDTTSDVWLTPA